jgi:hypothetical protein
MSTGLPHFAHGAIGPQPSTRLIGTSSRAMTARRELSRHSIEQKADTVSLFRMWIDGISDVKSTRSSCRAISKSTAENLSPHPSHSKKNASSSMASSKWSRWGRQTSAGYAHISRLRALVAEAGTFPTALTFHHRTFSMLDVKLLLSRGRPLAEVIHEPNSKLHSFGESDAKTLKRLEL